MNVPDLLKIRDFVPTVHLHLVVVLHRCCLLSLMKNNEQPHNIILPLSMLELYLRWSCTPPVSSGCRWAALCKRAEAKPQLLIFIIFGAPRVDLKSDCRDYETYNLKYGTIKCKYTAFCLWGWEGKWWYFPDIYCLLWASGLGCQ